MNDNLKHIEQALSSAFTQERFSEQIGHVVEVTGTIIKVIGLKASIGEICLLRNRNESWQLKTEVIGFANNAILLTPLGRMHGIGSSTEVVATSKQFMVPVGPGLPGRVLNGLAQPIDGKDEASIRIEDYYPIFNEPPNPLTRKIIKEPFSLGIRAIDGLITCCEGQRLGIFAGAGYGKSTLLGMICRFANADINVLALIGERGREVREFLEVTLGDAGMRKSILVVATSDRSSMERNKAAYIATAIAEYYRDKGKRVLLMLDSVTRFARAQRELGLALGEPPTRRGFPPSLFSNLPLLLERAGQSDRGSITAIYTVLVEGDDVNEPVADEMRSLLDGHIVLSGAMVRENHYPAIDVLPSVSRVMSSVVSEKHKKAAAALRSLLAKYREVELLVRIGEYKTGSDRHADRALEMIEPINTFLKQGIEEEARYEDTLNSLMRLMANEISA